MMGLVRATGLALALALMPVPSVAQQYSLGSASELRTLDQDRLFRESRFGQRVSRQLEEASRALAAENRRLESELVARERELTELREEMSPEEFGPLAEEFDTRAEEIRSTQEEKSRAITRRNEAERQRFFEAAVPILRDLLEEMGAVAILDSRAVVLASRRIDITDEAIARLDATLGAGGAEGMPPLPELPDAPSSSEPAPEDSDQPPEGPPLQLSPLEGAE